MSRHRASDPDDETTIIPKIDPAAEPPRPGPRPPAYDSDATTVIPAIPAEPPANPWAAPPRPVPSPPPGRSAAPPRRPTVPPGRPTSMPPGSPGQPVSGQPVSPAQPVSPSGPPVSPGQPVSPSGPGYGQPVSGQPISPGQPVSPSGPGYGQPVSPSGPSGYPGQPVPGQPVSGQPVSPARPISPGPANPPGTPSAADETTVIPAIIDSATPDGSAAPRVPDDHTGLIGIIPDVLPPDEEEAPKLRYKDTTGAPIRAVRMKDAYASAYSDYTRVTVGSVIRTTLRTTGELLITFGLVILLFAAYEVWGKTAIVDAHQGDLDRALTQEWDSQPVTQQPTAPVKELPPPPGNAIGRLYIPRLAKHWVVVEGVAPGDIRYAPGHYPNSAMPGEKGNFAMAGHRMRSVFWDLDQLEVGDKIVVETQRTWFVYAVVKERIVKPTQVEVVSAAPPGVPAGKLLTITTCNPKWDNYQRLIIHAELVGQQSRSDGPPPELGG